MREDDPLDNLAFECKGEDAGVEMVVGRLLPFWCGVGRVKELLGSGAGGGRDPGLLRNGRRS